MNSSWETLKILSDSTRLRLLALLLKEELSVAELQEILGMAQSRISSQLALLRQAGFVSDRREGKKAFYSLRPDLPNGTVTLLKAACESVADLPESTEDSSNLNRSLQKRRQLSEQYFNLIAGRLGKNHCPGRSWEAIGQLALRLVPAITVADLGAGEGLISQLLAHRAARVWCIDNSAKMVAVGSQLAKKTGSLISLINSAISNKCRCPINPLISPFFRKLSTTPATRKPQLTRPTASSNRAVSYSCLISKPTASKKPMSSTAISG